jgi:uncharacterized protein (TIGR02246 family)
LRAAPCSDRLIGSKHIAMDTKSIEKLHEELLTYWNNQNASGMASLFTNDANVIGFDGSQMNGQEQIETELKRVFANHQTAGYVWKVEEIRFLNSQVALLRAIVGMIPPGKKEINPATNAIQTLIGIKQNDVWQIALFQNTPAQFHGRPELVDGMTKELSKLISSMQS